MQAESELVPSVYSSRSAEQYDSAHTGKGLMAFVERLNLLR
jgi:hypothetical protein